MTRDKRGTWYPRLSAHEVYRLEADDLVGTRIAVAFLRLEAESEAYRRLSIHLTVPTSRA